MTARSIALLLALAAALAAQPQKLTIAAAQIGVEPDLPANLAKVLSYTRRAAQQGAARVVVFPEGSIEGDGPAMEDALGRIASAAKSAGIYVVLGGASRDPKDNKVKNWMAVYDPNGRRIFGYDKIYDRRGAPLPGVFPIDGIPCNAMICADRWLRGVEELPIMNGARISFELSNNFNMEWVDPFGWYWYVPRALRNGVHVVFLNVAFNHLGPSHGHSAFIAPDGRILASVADNSERLLVQTIDVAEANRAEALRRRGHPALKEFWETGSKLLDGMKLSAEPPRPLTSPETGITVAAVQMACSRDIDANLARMESLIRTAAGRGADVVVFPELTVTGALAADVQSARAARLRQALERVQSYAKAAGVHVVFGMPDGDAKTRTNSAFAIGPDGALLTRYDQMAVDRPDLFREGADPHRMWFRVKGVPAIVTIGRDALWSEISEMAAIAGAQLQITISYDPATGPAAALRRTQIWSNAASYDMLTVAVNAADPATTAAPSLPADGGSIIWDDLNGIEETRAAVRQGSITPAPGLAVDSPFSANAVVRADAGEQILYVTRRVNRTNPHYGNRTVRYTPQLAPWFSIGARTLGPPAGF